MAVVRVSRSFRHCLYWAIVGSCLSSGKNFERKEHATFNIVVGIHSQYERFFSIFSRDLKYHHGAFKIPSHAESPSRNIEHFTRKVLPALGP